MGFGELLLLKRTRRLFLTFKVIHLALLEWQDGWIEHLHKTVKESLTPLFSSVANWKWHSCTFCWWFTSIAWTSLFVMILLSQLATRRVVNMSLTKTKVCAHVCIKMWHGLRVHAWLRLTDGPIGITHRSRRIISPSLEEREREGEEKRGRETTHWDGTGVQIRLPLAVPGGALLCWWFFNDPSLATGSLYCHEWQADGEKLMD